MDFPVPAPVSCINLILLSCQLRISKCWCVVCRLLSCLWPFCFIFLCVSYFQIYKLFGSHLLKKFPLLTDNGGRGKWPGCHLAIAKLCVFALVCTFLTTQCHSILGSLALPWNWRAIGLVSVGVVFCKMQIQLSCSLSATVSLLPSCGGTLQIQFCFVF